MLAHGVVGIVGFMILLVPEGTEPRWLEGLPAQIEIAYLPKEDPLSGKAQKAEFALAPYGSAARHFFAVLPELKQLKVVQTMTAGVDWILPKMPPGITLCDAAGVHDIPVSEWIVAAILAAIKKFPEFRDAQREQRWAYQWVDDLEGSTVLFLGYGSIAKAAEKRLAPFGVEFLKVARSARDEVFAFSDLTKLLPKAHIVVNLLPYTPETDKLVKAEHFAQMKPGALFVNAGRGKTVDQDALVEAIKAKQVRFVSDVTDPEPLPEGHPLWSLPEVFFTPHMAGSTYRLFERGHKLLREQVGRYLRGEPLVNVVQAEKGY